MDCSTKKRTPNDIAEILLKVALNTIYQTKSKHDVCIFGAGDSGNIDTELKKRYKTVLPINRNYSAILATLQITSYALGV